jgi:hypothetical protein
MSHPHPTNDDALIPLALAFEEPFIRWHEGNATRIAWEVEEAQLLEELRPLVQAIISHKATTRAGRKLQVMADTMLPFLTRPGRFIP